MSTTSEELNTVVKTQSEVSAAIPLQNNMSAENVSNNVSNHQCAVGLQVNGDGNVTVSGDVVVTCQTQHNHTEECQVDRLIKNVKNETDKTVVRVTKEAQRSEKKVEKEIKRFMGRF